MSDFYSLVAFLWFFQASFAVEFKGYETERKAKKFRCTSEFHELKQGRIKLLTPDLPGHWVSESCETVPGPKFMLRAYHFLETGGFMLHKYFYEDPWCSRPSHVVVAEGNIAVLSQSWDVQGSHRFEYQLRNVQLISYSRQIAKKLSRKLNESCPDAQEFLPIRQLQPFVLFRQLTPTIRQWEDVYRVDKPETVDKQYLDCQHSLDLNFDELNLLQMLENDGQRVLMVGRALKDVKTGLYERPTSFQQPLFNAYEILDCKVCKKIRDSNSFKPPKLRLDTPVKSMGETYLREMLNGNWLSTDCESLPNGFYTIRQMSFSTEKSRWSLRQRYFDDPLCKDGSMKIIANGKFLIGPKQTKYADATFQVLFQIFRLRLVPRSNRVARNLQRAPNCGSRGAIWRRGKSVDLASTHGCEPLGLKVPSVNPDLLTIRPPFLFTGDHASITNDSSPFPSSFGGALTKCLVQPEPVIISIEAKSKKTLDKSKYLPVLSSSNDCQSQSLNFLVLCFVQFFIVVFFV